MLAKHSVHLLADLGEDGQEEKDAEHLVLHATSGVIGVQDRQADCQRLEKITVSDNVH